MFVAYWPVILSVVALAGVAGCLAHDLDGEGTRRGYELPADRN
jgi:hypothetical protein